MINAEDAPPEFWGLQLKAPEPFTFVPEVWPASRKQVNAGSESLKPSSSSSKTNQKGSPIQNLCVGYRDRSQVPDDDSEQDESEGKPYSKSRCRGDRDRNQDSEDDSE
jgi:hypothetical protein